MFFLIKSFVKTSFKNKARFFALFIFSFLTIFLLLSSLSTSKYFNGVKDDIKENQLKYEYKIDYNSRKTSSNKVKETITPFAIMGNNNIKVNFKTNYYFSFANLEINKDIKSDILITLEEFETNFDKFNYFEFLNINSKALIHNSNNNFLNLFYQTKIFKSINDYSNGFINYWKNKGLNNEEIIIKYFELNLEYRHEFKNIDYSNFKELDLPVIYKTKDTNGNISTNYNQLYEIGLGGKLGIFAIEEYKDLFQPEKSYTKLIYFIGKNMYSSIEEEITNYEIAGSLFIDNLYDNSYFINDFYFNLDLFESYFQIIANSYNFDMKYRNQFTFYNSLYNEKIKFVDWSIQDIYGNKNNNSVNLKINKKVDKFNEFFPTTILINQAYATKNNINLGDSIQFETGETTLKWNVSGVALDYNEIYPLIYDNDLIPNSKNELIIYANRSFFENKNNIPDSYIIDNSKILFSYNGINLTKDSKLLEKSLFTNSFGIRDKKKEFLQLQKNNVFNTYLREDLIFDVIKYVQMFLFVICSILLLLTVISILVIILKNINLNLQKIGVLKALGCSNLSISISFSINVLMPILIGSLVAYPFMFFGQWFLMFNLSSYFNALQITFTTFIFYSFITIIFFNLLVFLISVFYAFLIVRKNPISLINQNLKSSKKLTLKLKRKGSFTTRMSKVFVSNSLSKTISLFVTLFVSSLFYLL